MAEHGLNSPVWRTRSPSKVLILLILFSLLATAIAGLTAALRGPDLAALWFSLLIGLLLAWGLAYIRQPAFRAILFLFLVGCLYLLLLPGGLASKLVPLISGAIRWLLGLIPYYHGGKTDASQLASLLLDFDNTAAILVQRSQAWMKALAAGNPAFDPLAANLVWNAVVWIVACWAGWMLETFGNAFLAVLPALLLSLGTLSSGQRMVPGLYLLLGLTLLLLGVEKQERRQRDWNADGSAYPAHKGRQIINSALLISVMLVLLSAGLSSLSAERIRHWIDELRKPVPQQKSNLAQSLGIVPAGTIPPDPFKAVRSPGLPRDHLIGSGPELSGRVVMTVKVADLPDLSQGGQPLPLYWRGFTYDIYTGQGWSSSETSSSPVAVNAAMEADHAMDHLLIQEDFSPVEDLGGTIYASGEPVRVNIPSEIAWRSPGDLFGLQSETASAYEVFSLIPIVDAEELRRAGETYPDWVVKRFLSLQPDVPERVKSLALRLTASAITPYDRAVAIENYLRTYPYTLDVPFPPPQRDVTDYFLFDLKKGYCDYFATAMVVLARASGIPARLAIGYASGTYNLNSKRFIVTEADAHSWAEVYFPEIGWVPVEATPSRPVLDRSQPFLTEPTPAGILPSQPSGQVQKNGIPWLSFPEVLVGLLALLGIVWLGVDGYRLRKLSGLAAAVEVYRRLRQHAYRLGIQTEPGATPYEFSQALRTGLGALNARGLQVFIKSDLLEDVQKLIGEIVFASFRAPSSSVAGLASQWQRLRWQLWLVWILKIVKGRRISGYSQSGESVG